MVESRMASVIHTTIFLLPASKFILAVLELTVFAEQLPSRKCTDQFSVAGRTWDERGRELLLLLLFKGKCVQTYIRAYDNIYFWKVWNWQGSHPTPTMTPEVQWNWQMEKFPTSKFASGIWNNHQVLFLNWQKHFRKSSSILYSGDFYQITGMHGSKIYCTQKNVDSRVYHPMWDHTKSFAFCSSFNTGHVALRNYSSGTRSSGHGHVFYLAIITNNQMIWTFISFHAGTAVASNSKVWLEMGEWGPIFPLEKNDRNEHRWLKWW